MADEWGQAIDGVYGVFITQLDRNRRHYGADRGEGCTHRRTFALRGQHQTRAAGASDAEVLELQCVGYRLGERTGLEEIPRFLLGIAPKSSGTDEERHDGKQENRAERIRHHGMRNDRVERAFAVRVGREKYRAIDREGHRQQKKRQARRSNQADDKTVALESPRKGAGPGVLLVCLRPDLSEHLREVELELVRRRVLAGVVARAAVV